MEESSSPNSLFESEYSGKAPQQTTWISVADAAMLLKVKPYTVIRRIEKGTLPGRTSPDTPFTVDGKSNYEVRLECLPQRIQYQYLYSHLPKEEKCSADLVSPRSFLGNIWLDEFLDISSLIREVETIRRENHSTGKITEHLKETAKRHGISLATLYRLTGKPAAKTISSMYTDPFYLQDRLPVNMCLWSCDLAFTLYLEHDNLYSQNEITKELSKKENIPCSQCPYYANNVEDILNSSVPICRKSEGGHMVVPKHRKTVNRLLAHVPPQMVLFARQGYRKWRAEYGLFVVRDRPLLAGECFIGDHHKFDCFCRVTIQKEHYGKIYQKEIAVRPTLTAWLDAATWCPVGWVISILPNSDTIAEAFCRAVVLTPGSPFHGLPLCCVVDCGKDYKSRLLEDLPADLNYTIPEDTMLNKRFAGMGLLQAMGVKVYHALPYQPQSKPIERFFGSIEKIIQKEQPGWCHCKIEDRPADFQKMLDRKLKSKELPELEKFALWFQNTLLPEYYGSIDPELPLPEFPGWSLSGKSMSPMQKYNALEKVQTVTPDWNTLSILKMHYKEGCQIGRYGIRFRNVFYQADELAFLGNEKVDILYHNVQPPYAPSSISVIHNGHYLCEAFPAERKHMTGDSPLDIAINNNRQKRPAREIQKSLSRLRRSSEAILPENALQTPDEKSQLYDMAYAPAVADEQSADEKTPVETAKDVKININESLRFLFGDE